MNSHVFQKMFFGSIEGEHQKIQTPDIKSDNFKEFLKYVYTQAIEFKCYE